MTARFWRGPLWALGMWWANLGNMHFVWLRREWWWRDEMGKFLQLVHGLQSAFVFLWNFPSNLASPAAPSGEKVFTTGVIAFFNFPRSIASSFHNYNISPWKTGYSFWKLQPVSSEHLSQCPAFHGCTFDPLGNAGSGPAGISYRMKINLRTDGDSPGSDSDLFSFTRPHYVSLLHRRIILTLSPNRTSYI